MGCCFGKTDKSETEPLLDDQKKATKSTTLDFARLEVQEFDGVFSDFARTLNPFVTDREKLEQAVTKFKTAVESIQDVRPQASFREYVVALKTKLKNEGIFIKIKNGAVEVYGVAGRTIEGVDDAISAVKTILAAGEALKDMPQVVTTASGSSVEDAESSLENIDHIIKREFSGVCDICKIVRFRKNLTSNMKKLRNAPRMVKDFCEEVKSIVEEISEVLGDKTDEDDDKDNDASAQAVAAEDNNKNEEAQNIETNERESGEDGDKNEDDTAASRKSTVQERKKKKGKENDKKSKKDDKKKNDYHKQLKMETVGLADIDSLFTDLGTSLNKFITTREKMQQARESFEKIIKTICNFDGKKELKDYIKELKDKAKEGKMQIYIDTSNGEIKLDSVKGVDPPAPYRNAVKALNDIKASSKETLGLEPVLERGIESCARDITKIDPIKDFKKLVSGVKETMALPKKVKAFNENRKKVQQAPQIVKELCSDVKLILEDIVNAFKEDVKTKDKHEENEENADDVKEDKTAERNDKQEETVEATIHVPGKSTKIEKVENNNTNLAC